MKTPSLRTSLLAGALIAALAFTAGNGVAQDAPTVASPAAPQLSYGVPQILKMVRAKVSDDVIINYIRNSSTIYSLKADEIVYLKQQGVSDGVLNAMLNQRSRLAGSSASASTTAGSAASDYAPTAAPAPPVTYVQSPPATTVYVIPDTQTYQYDAWFYGGYPYGYPDCNDYGGYGLYPGVSVSLGFGNRWGGGFGGWHGDDHGGWHGRLGGGYHRGWHH